MKEVNDMKNESVSPVAQAVRVKGVRLAGDVAFAINARVFRILRELLGPGVSRRAVRGLSRDAYLRLLARRLAIAELVLAQRGLMEEYRGMVASHCMDAEAPASLGGKA